MDLVYAVALLGLAVILFVVVLLGNRMPDQPDWASEGMLADLSGVAITGLVAFGMSFGFRFVVSTNELAMGVKEVALVAVTLVAYFLIFRQLAPRRRLREYAAELARRSGMNNPPLTNVATITSPENNNDPSNEPTLPRAA